jgi:hypothetical protein
MKAQNVPNVEELCIPLYEPRNTARVMQIKHCIIKSLDTDKSKEQPGGYRCQLTNLKIPKEWPQTNCVTED